MDLRHHPGMHVEVNLQGKTIGGVVCQAGWVPGVVVGMSAMGTYLTVKLDTAIGGGEAHGLLHRPESGQDMVEVELDQARPLDPASVMSPGVPDDIIALARDGKKLDAIRKYRALNGASMDEARQVIDSL